MYTENEVGKPTDFEERAFFPVCGVDVRRWLEIWHYCVGRNRERTFL
jgi:hypothetical protein